MTIWERLGIEPTGDEREIKRAYARAAKQVHPEDDPEGFKQLRAAYDEAMALAKAPKAPPSTGAYIRTPDVQVQLESVTDPAMVEAFRSVEAAAQSHMARWQELMDLLDRCVAARSLRAAYRGWSGLFESPAFLELRGDRAFTEAFLGRLIDHGHLSNLNSARLVRRYLAAWREETEHRDLDYLFWTAARGLAPTRVPAPRRPWLLVVLIILFVLANLFGGGGSFSRTTTPSSTDVSREALQTIQGLAPTGDVAEWTGYTLAEDFWPEAKRIKALEAELHTALADALAEGALYGEVEDLLQALEIDREGYDHLRTLDAGELAEALEDYRPAERELADTHIHAHLLPAVQNDIPYGEVEELCQIVGITEERYEQLGLLYETVGINYLIASLRSHSVIDLDQAPEGTW